MWHDIEAKVDLLNFGLVADAAAQLIRDAQDEPLTIGVSGGWGTGKSSLVKMVGRKLAEDPKATDQYVFLDFNAWLYQGFEDARRALLEAVGDKLLETAQSRQAALDKAMAFAKRIRWFKVGRLVAPTATGALAGTLTAGPVGGIVGAVAGLVQGLSAHEDVSQQLEAVKKAYGELKPELADLVKERPDESLPKEIEQLRKSFEDLLRELNVKLVVLVDDLDRCLPQTAIATLEAMRLLLYVPRTAFIIAADEQMIRGAVRAHFAEVDIGDDLVTSYFDKLIQVPLRVPRLGVNEVRAYVLLLMADLARRQDVLPQEALEAAQAKILDALAKGWQGPLTAELMTSAFGIYGKKLQAQIDLADQLAPILSTAEQIAGNPRLIKRFMNNLMIRQAVANAQKVSFGFGELVKFQLFERCASSAAFDYLTQAISATTDGRAPFLKGLEDAASEGTPYVAPHPSWQGPFYEQWIRLNPKLGETPLFPYVYLSRDRVNTLAAYDELSPEGRALYDLLLKTDKVLTTTKAIATKVGEAESERVLVRLIRKARADSWAPASITRCFNITDAFPTLGTKLATALSEIPPAQFSVSIAPFIKDKEWAQSLKSSLEAEGSLPVKNYLTGKGKK